MLTETQVREAVGRMVSYGPCLTTLSFQMDGFFFTIHTKQKVEDK